MPFEQPNAASAATTHASYESDCPWCGGFIDEGDQIFLHDGDWVCEYCDDAEKGVSPD